MSAMLNIVYIQTGGNNAKTRSCHNSQSWKMFCVDPKERVHKEIITVSLIEHETCVEDMIEP